MGYNFLPGEVFIGRQSRHDQRPVRDRGISTVKFAGDQNFTVNFGAGFRVLPTDWLSIHIDVQDLVFRSQHYRRG